MDERFTMKKLNLGIGLLGCMLLVGCMPDSLTKYHIEPKKEEAAAAGATSSSTIPAVNLSTLTTFQVKNITANNTTYHMHKYGQANAAVDCEIPVSSLADGETLLTDQTGDGSNSSANDIVCWLEAEELQLYHNGVDLQINVPAGYCDYVRIEPYFFWQWIPANTNKTLKAVTCDDSAAGYCTAAGGVQTPSVFEQACVADYSKQVPDPGPNCDEGSVTINTYAYTSPGAVVTTYGEPKKCGGKRSNCLAGPGKDYHVNTGGYPVGFDHWTWSGETVTYSVTKPDNLGKNLFSNRYVANYTNQFTTGTYTYDYTTVTSITGLEKYSDYDKSYSYSYAATLQAGTSTGSTTTVAITRIDTSVSGITSGAISATDYASDPLKDSSGTVVNPFYTFTCLNSAEEVKGRIRLQVREWNQKFTTTTLAGDQVNRANHSRIKRHSSSSTDYETSGIKYWNDVMDWDTVLSYGSNAAYLPSSSPPGISVSGYAFPMWSL